MVTFTKTCCARGGGGTDRGHFRPVQPAVIARSWPRDGTPPGADTAGVSRSILYHMSFF